MRVNCEPPENRQVRVIIAFDPEDVRLEHTLIGVNVHLEGCRTVGEPGAPALPHYRIRVALPATATATELAMRVTGRVAISEDAVPIAPLQTLRPAIDSGGEPASYRRPHEGPHDRVKGVRDRQDDDRFVQPFPVPPYVPPNPERYAAASRGPVARLVETRDEGLTPVLAIEVDPVRITARGGLELFTGIELAVGYALEDEDEDAPRRDHPAHIVSRAQAMRQIALTRMTVVNPSAVVDFSDRFPVINLGTDYLIVTDNQRWNAETMAPTGAVDGDLVASFERLADWKAQRGLRARVVTISDIVANRYGDFRTGSRDLQEVLRRFLKMAQSTWGVAWVLLGGDTDIVPIRRVASDALGFVTRQAVNPPPENSSCWTGAELRIHATNLGPWWETATTNLLVRPDTGLLIAYDAAGTSGPFIARLVLHDGQHLQRAQRHADGVRPRQRTGQRGERGPAVPLLHGTRFRPICYYSSLVGPHYGFPGRHDWDLTGNGLYGQHAGQQPRWDRVRADGQPGPRVGARRGRCGPVRQQGDRVRAIRAPRRDAARRGLDRPCGAGLGELGRAPLDSPSPTFPPPRQSLSPRAWRCAHRHPPGVDTGLELVAPQLSQ